MTERPHDTGPAHGAHGAPAHGAHGPDAATDAELSVRGIVGFGIGLAVLIAVSLALVWLLSAHLKSAVAAADPEPSPLAEANAHRQPPEPRLQTAPVGDMKTLRAHEDEVLGGYGAPDPEATVRIPIDRAIDILAERGLPEPHAAPGASGPSGGTPSPGTAAGSGTTRTPQGAAPPPPASPRKGAARTGASASAVPLEGRVR